MASQNLDGTVGECEVADGPDAPVMALAGNVTATYILVNLTGADELDHARTLGAMAGETTLDDGGDLGAITVGLAAHGAAGTYAYPTSVTTDDKGRVTEVVAGSAPTHGILAGGNLHALAIAGGAAGFMSGAQVTALAGALTSIIATDAYLAALTSLPPDGPASGDLTGTYPGPTLAAAGTAGTYAYPTSIVTDTKGRVTTVVAGSAPPSSLPPDGPASGDLTGTYPAPTLAAAGTAGTYAYPTSIVTDAKGRVTSVVAGSAPPSSLPPSGAASGDLGGTYPGPTVAKVTTTTGPTSLTIGAVADGEYLRRVGTTLVGALAGTIDGAGAATRLAYWSDADTLTSDAALTFASNLLGVVASASATTVKALVSNTSNTASSHALAEVVVAGASGGNPSVRLNINGLKTFDMLIDNATSDRAEFRVDGGTVLSFGTYGGMVSPAGMHTPFGGPATWEAHSNFNANIVASAGANANSYARFIAYVTAGGAKAVDLTMCDTTNILGNFLGTASTSYALLKVYNPSGGAAAGLKIGTAANNGPVVIGAHDVARFTVPGSAAAITYVDGNGVTVSLG